MERPSWSWHRTPWQQVQRRPWRPCHIMLRQLWLHAQTTAVTRRSGAGSRDSFDADQQAVEVYLRSDQARSKRAFVVPVRTAFFSSAEHAFAEPFPPIAPLVKL